MRKAARKASAGQAGRVVTNECSHVRFYCSQISTDNIRVNVLLGYSTKARRSFYAEYFQPL